MRRIMSFCVVVLLSSATSTKSADLSIKPDQPLTAPKPPRLVNVDDLDFGLRDPRRFKRSDIPERILRLDGKRVRIYGDMQPTFRATGLKGFIFSGDTRGRFYHSSWSLVVPLHLSIPVYLRKGTSTSYTGKPIVIEGIIRVKPWVFEGKVLRLYKIEDATSRETERRTGFKRSVGHGC